MIPIIVSKNLDEMRSDKEKFGYILLFAAAFIAFALGYIHHKWFFPLYFDGDAAAMHVLAKVIVAERSLLPSDFSYGNQLVFLRSSPFIALAILSGFTGYKAYIFGSTLSIVFWSVVLHWFVSLYVKSQKKGLLFTALLLIPLGFWDADYVLGQQSHLANVVLALGMIFCLQLHIIERTKSFLFIACFCLFLMSLEAPMRGLLVLAPVVIAIYLVTDLRSGISVSFYTASSFCIAYIANGSLLKIHPITLNYFNTLTFKSVSEFFENIIRMVGVTVAAISSWNTVSGKHISALGFIVLTSGMLLVLAYFCFMFAGVLKAIRLGRGKIMNPTGLLKYHDKDGENIIDITAALGVLIGLFAVSVLNPDTPRHYLWAIFLIKFCLFIWLYNIYSIVITERWAWILVLLTSLMASSWFAALVVHGWNIENVVNSRNSSDPSREIEIISKKTGIKNIYGEDFWRMMPLNSKINDINAQALVLGAQGIEILPWLTRPSWSCVNGDVLYYLKSGLVDKAIEEKLKISGGVKVHYGDGYSLWTGPPVWQIPPAPRCYVQSLVFDNGLFRSLPANVGFFENGSRKTNGKSGYLAYGPYAAMKAGNYRLNVYGSSESIEGSYVDVVSDNGRLVHAHFDLIQYPDALLVRDAAVQLPADFSDIEIRVWVSERDSLQIRGYKLNVF